MKKVIAFLIWTAVCVYGTVSFLWKIPNASWEDSGRDFTFTTDNSKVFATNGPSEIEAASPWFFLLRNEATNQVITSASIKRPLGWDYNEYHVVAPTDLPEGTWLVDKGQSITIHLTSSSDIKVIESNNHNRKYNGYFFFAIVGIFLWIAGIAAGHGIHEEMKKEAKKNK